jgi:hypothetical protein
VADSSTISDPTTLYTPVNTAIITYMAGLALGAAVDYSSVIVAIRGVSGVISVQALTLNGLTTSVPGNPSTIYRTDAAHITASHG